MKKRWVAEAALAVLLVTLPGQRASAQETFLPGDVFVAVGNGSVQWRRPNGTLVRTMVSGIDSNGFTTGMAFDGNNNLYVTMFSFGAISVFNNTGTFTGTFGSGFDANPESIVFDNVSNVYVGQAGGTFDILKFDSAGNFLNSFNVQTGPRGSDWIDLAQDQCTMFYTSEGTTILRFDVCTGTQLANFNATPLPGSAAFALRILPSGGLLVADSQSILRLDALGNIIQTYDAPGQNSWFALNLDPDGTSFWSADFTTADVFKFDIATGAVLQNFNSGTGPLSVFGITINGEITAAQQLPPPPEISLPTTRPPFHGSCITRTARYWFTHPFGGDSNCATLLNAIEVNGGVMPIGFMGLPLEFRNSDNVRDARDAVIEALGLFWKSGKLTGEDSGTQSQKFRGTSLCRERKQLAVELIAAIANNAFLGTAPQNCSHVNGGVRTSFPADLIEQAGAAAAGEDVLRIRALTLLLRQFNSSGVTNDFVAGRVECSAVDRKSIRAIARDPTTRVSCPGINDFCQTAQAIVHFPFSDRVDLFRYTNTLPGSSCGLGGAEAVWKIAPPVAATGRQFTVDTFGSNFDTILSVRRGQCNALTEVTCNDNADGTLLSRVTFTTDGSSTYFIVAEGRDGAVGRLKLRVVSH